MRFANCFSPVRLTVFHSLFSGRWRHALGVLAILLAGSSLARAHPHAFVDGGVDFMVAEDQTLEALRVTWLLDEFESLYMLSAAEITLNSKGDLDETERLAFEAQMRTWLSDFAGSAHATVEGDPVGLKVATGLTVELIEGRLKMTFLRPLHEPIAVAGLEMEVGFFEGTYFYAHSVTQPSRITGTDVACTTRTVLFDTEKNYPTIQATLARLGREEEPDDPNVGALFADRIFLTCA